MKFSVKKGCKWKMDEGKWKIGKMGKWEIGD